MWVLGVVIPVVIVASIITGWTLYAGSGKFHFRQHERLSSGVQVRRGLRPRAGCPLCAAQFDGESAGEVVAARNRHFLRRHASPDGSPIVRQGSERSA